MNTRLLTKDAEETERCGRALAGLLHAGDVILMTGDLGAGKTMLTKGIAQGLGVNEPVTSPTFNIMVAHEGRLTLFHFDLYRLERAEELEDVDYYATLESEGVSVVEWGDRFEEAQPQDGLLVSIRITGDEERGLELLGLGPRGRVLAAEWAALCAPHSSGDVR